jgi:protein-tyrosine phosphatase
MYFQIANSYSIKNLKPRGNKPVLILCLSESEYNNLSYLEELNNSYSNILKLNIEDKENFDLSNAKLLNNFILENNFDEVITCCALGMSRSPAIMICISKILNCPKIEELVKENYKFYNKYIVNTFEQFPYITKNIENKEYILNKQIIKTTKQLIKIE